MSKARIVERTKPNGEKVWVIQQRHFIFRWWWVDAWLNCGSYCNDTFHSLEEAEKHMCWFDGTKCRDKVVKP